MRVRTRARAEGRARQGDRHAGRFQLIEVMIPRGVLSESLLRFVYAVKRLNAGKAG